MGGVDKSWYLQRLVKHSGHEHQHLQRERNDTMNLRNVRVKRNNKKHLQKQHVADILIKTVLES